MRTYRQSIRFGLMLTAASIVGAGAYAAAPTVGSVIGNQATASYVNVSGDTINVTSNKVETIVQQVAGLTLVADNDETVAPGGKVFLPHTVTNDGNGSDVFDLTTLEGAGDFDFTSINIYPDANFDGVADSTTPITVTPTLTSSGQPGSSYGIVIEATVPSGAIAGDSEEITVTATSQFSGVVTPLSATNTDTVTVTTDAVTEIVKAMTVDKGADGITGPGDLVTIKLTYSSTGLTDATDLIVEDVLNRYLVYNTGSALWSDDAATLTEADDGYEQQNGTLHSIDFQYKIDVPGDVNGDGEGDDIVSFQIDTAPSGRTGSVTFTATIRADAPAGDIPNIATQTVNGVDFPPSNEATITVAPVYQVTVADAESLTHRTGTDGDPGAADGNLGGVTSNTDDDANLNDIVEETTDTSQGGSIPFEFVLTNHSNGDDTVDVSVANAVANGFPTGTTFQIVDGADGATPIVGPISLAQGATTTVQVIATLPPNATATAANATNYEAVLTAQSTNGGDPNTSTALFTGAVTAAAVDLQNSPVSGDGPNPTDPGGNPWIDFPTDPGTPVSFPVTIENLGPTADTYDLTLEDPLPVGWTVSFLLPDGTPITNTGAIPAGDDIVVTVVVTPTPDSPPLTQDINIGVTSPTSGQGDTLVNSVTVKEIVDLAISSDQTVQGAPGGTVDIPHVIENQGNIAITEGAISLAGTFSDFSGAIFYDANGNGTVDPTEVVIDNINDIGGLAIGEEKSLILRVSIPSTGTVGISETETINVATLLNLGADTDGDAADNAVTDTVKIVSGDLTLVKEQAVDPLCNGTLGTFTKTQVQAEPGQCVRYRITATNTGTDAASSVSIKDAVPTFTTILECGGASTTCNSVVTPAPGSSFVTKPASGSTGPIESSHGTLIGGDPATLSFTVRIDN